MNVVSLIVFGGIALIGLLGLSGRKRSANVEDWTVGGHRLGSATMWFLQAGEMFTIFTFLGVAGLGFTVGVAALYALLYIPLAYTGLYFLGPRLWRRCREHGYLTQADFVGGFFRSRLLGGVVAVLGVVFVLPYLQLQLTGLGLAIQLATGDLISGDTGIVIAFAITVGFVLWSGIRGVARVSYLKDVLMIGTVVVLAVLVPVQAGGGFGAVFGSLARSHPGLLFVHSGPNDTVWFVSSTVVCTLGIMFLTLPHMWPEVLAARSARALRRNYVFLPAYSVAMVFPVVVGLAAVLTRHGGDSNAVLLSLIGSTLPGWLTGVVVLAVVATAMVPAGGIIIGISSLVARNVLRPATPRGQYRVTIAAALAASALALTLALSRPDLIANLLLLTYSGLVQLVPAIALALIGRRFAGKWPVLAGITAGVATVVLLTPPFGHLSLGHVNAGLVGLAANLLVLALGIGVERVWSWRREPVPAPVRHTERARELEPLRG